MSLLRLCAVLHAPQATLTGPLQTLVTGATRRHRSRWSRSRRTYSAMQSFQRRSCRRARTSPSGSSASTAARSSRCRFGGYRVARLKTC